MKTGHRYQVAGYQLARIGLLTLLLTGFCALRPAICITMIDGVPVPNELMQLARTAVLGNSPQAALMRGGTPFSAHPFFKELIARIDFTKVNEEAAKAMVQMFTRDEMHALVKFQQSPEGQSINRKMSGYQQVVGAIVQNQMKNAMEAYLLTNGLQGKVGLDGRPVKQHQSPVAPSSPRTGGVGGVGGLMGLPQPPAVVAPSPKPAPPAGPMLKGMGGSPIGQ